MLDLGLYILVPVESCTRWKSTLFRDVICKQPMSGALRHCTRIVIWHPGIVYGVLHPYLYIKKQNRHGPASVVSHCAQRVAPNHTNAAGYWVWNASKDDVSNAIHYVSIL